MTEETIHDFEKAGLGKAPFHYLGAEERRGPETVTIDGVECQVGAPGQPMGTCDYCGQGIAICCRIGSSDKKEFTVGIDCVRRTGDAGLKAATDKKIRAIKLKTRHASEAKRIAAAIETIKRPEVRQALDRLPHPRAEIWKRRKSMLDFAEWMLKYAGTAGKMKAAKAIEKAAQGK